MKEDANYLNRLTKSKSKSAYESGLALLNKNIGELNKRKETLGLDEDFKNHTAQLDDVKYSINKLSSIQSRLKLRKQLIEEAVAELEKQTSHIDLEQLKDLYTEASNNVAGIQKTFDDLVVYHNSMIQQKARFISSDLADITGRKQGEILCFDLAYILFARKEHIPCMEFLMNDKKELLHSNQLQQVSDFVRSNTVQLILPILKDKVPESLLTEDTIVLELSQDSKLFKIEETEKK